MTFIAFYYSAQSAELLTANLETAPMLRILIVEDDDAIREILHTYLCDYRLNRECKTAKTLNEALKLVESERFDLIFLDLLLQGEIATPIIERVKELYADSPPLIVVLSAMSGAAKIGEQFSVNKVITKPFDFESIDELVPLGK